MKQLNIFLRSIAAHFALIQLCYYLYFIDLLTILCTNDDTVKELSENLRRLRSKFDSRLTSSLFFCERNGITGIICFDRLKKTVFDRSIFGGWENITKDFFTLGVCYENWRA